MYFQNDRNMGKLAVVSIWGPKKNEHPQISQDWGEYFFGYRNVPFGLVEKHIEYNIIIYLYRVVIVKVSLVSCLSNAVEFCWGEINSLQPESCCLGLKVWM